MHRSIAIGLLAAAACASGPTTTLPPVGGNPRTTRYEGPDGAFELETHNAEYATSHNMPSSAEQVWAALPAMFQELGLRGGIVDPERRVFAARNTKLRGRLAGQPASKFLDCGSSISGPNADRYEITLSVVALVKPVGPLSQLEVRVEASARPLDVSGHAVTCSSPGRLEQLVASRAAEHAR